MIQSQICELIKEKVVFQTLDRMIHILWTDASLTNKMKFIPQYYSLNRKYTEHA